MKIIINVYLLLLPYFVFAQQPKWEITTSENAVQSHNLNAFSAADSDTVVNYFPLSIGNWWRYQDVYVAEPYFTDTTFVFDTLSINNILYYTVGTNPLYPNHFRYDSIGNVYISLNDSTEQIRYKFDLMEGDTFMYVHPIWPETTVVTVISTTDTLWTNAGFFSECIQLYVDILGSWDEEFSIWFAPDVGIVRKYYGFGTHVTLYSAKIGTTYYGDIVSIEHDVVSTLKYYSLTQNYPNPFNPLTIIEYTLPIRTEVNLIIYNLRGQEVTRLHDGEQPAGYHTLSWNASNFASGIYFYRLQAGDFVQTRKMVFLK